jgi:hypothetical protein
MAKGERMKKIITFALSSEAAFESQHRHSWRSAVANALLFAATIASVGCGSTLNTTSKSTPPPPPTSVSYFAPAMSSGTLSTYAIDTTANTFVRTTYGVTGPSISDAGDLASYSNGVYGLEPTYLAGISGSLTQPAPSPEGWSVEIPGQAALVEVNIPGASVSGGGSIPPLGYFAPAVPSSACPVYTSAQSFLFVTMPKTLARSNSTTIGPGSWNPQLETAYGSVQVTTKDSAVQLASVTQSIFPASGGGSSPPSNPGPGSATAACSPSYYGQVISVPTTVTVGSPGGDETFTPTATIAIGPTGFLLEDSGTTTNEDVPYANILGAGYGAIGLPQPKSDETAAVVAAQYQGFITAPGSTSSISLISAFGPASSSQSSCSAFQSELNGAGFTPSANTVYGGEYPENGAASSPLGSANCDVAVDLGTVGSGGNGLYTQATVYLGSTFPDNGNNAPYSFPAVAVAGQIDGQAAIFLIGVDTTGSPSRAWGIYLLDSE